MPSPESSPGSVPTDEVVEERIEAIPQPESEPNFVSVTLTSRRKPKERFMEVQSRVAEDVSLLIEPGTELDITKKDEAEFYRLAQAYAQVATKIEELEEEEEGQKSRQKKLIEFAERFGLRGVESVLQIIPARTVTVDLEATQEVFGAAYRANVQEQLGLNIPLGGVTQRGVIITRELVLEILKRGLERKGLPEVEAEEMVNQRLTLKMSEGTLNQLKSLRPEAVDEKPGWQIKPLL